MFENDRAPNDATGEPQPRGDVSDGATADSPQEQDNVGGEAFQVEIESLGTELKEARDHALRCQAELENYRKRIARQIEDERRYANLPLLRDLLNVWDSMGRALEAAEQTRENDSLLEGFTMVVRQLEDVLARHHCVKMEALGKPFDPHLHEAIMQQPSDEYPPGTVMLETQTGFQLHDRVVRPSQVIVSEAGPQQTEYQ